MAAIFSEPGLFSPPQPAEEEDGDSALALEVQLAEAMVGAACTADAALAMRLAVGLEKEGGVLDEDREAARSATQAAAFSDALNEALDVAAARRSAKDEAAALDADRALARRAHELGAAQRALADSDAGFARWLSNVPERQWRHDGDLLTGNNPQAALRVLKDSWDAEAAAARGRDRHRREAEGPVQRVKKNTTVIPCPICLEDVLLSECVTPVVAQGQQPCAHSTCRGCAAEYVKSIVRDGKVLVPCPGDNCRQSFFDEPTVLGLLLSSEQQDDDNRVLARYRELQALSTLGDLLVYCPHPGCSQPLEAPPRDDPNWPRASCPSCQREMCVSCKAPGWHAELSCEAFMRLPPELRNADDAAVLALAGQQGWRTCPGCRTLIERNADGCNFVKCRCGVAFCYACGEGYEHERLTAANVHGKPSCKCALFTDDAEARPLEAVARELDLARQNAVARVRRLRSVNRRDPNRRGKFFRLPRDDRLCRISPKSLLACPRGRKCWFRHEDEP